MVAQKYGKADINEQKGYPKSMAKEKTDRPMRGPGTDPKLSALIGGVSNRTTNPSMKKGRKKA